MKRTTRNISEDISERCLVSQKIRKAFIWFFVCILSQDELVLGDELSLNLAFLGDKAVLHVSDTATYFSVSKFFDAHSESHGQSVQETRLAVALIWRLTYIKYSNRLCTD